MKLKITINDNVLTATLNGSQASREFAGLLPLTLQLSDYAGEEKIGDLPARLSTADSPVGSAASKGDIMVFYHGAIWPFYQAHGYVDGLIPLGRLDEPDALPLQPSSYPARFELAAAASLGSD